MNPLTSHGKVGTLSWRSMQNYSRPNSGSIIHIHVKLGAGVESRGGITRHDSKVKRSKVKLTRSCKVFSQRSQ